MVDNNENNLLKVDALRYCAVAFATSNYAILEDIVTHCCLDMLQQYIDKCYYTHQDILIIVCFRLAYNIYTSRAVDFMNMDYEIWSNKKKSLIALKYQRHIQLNFKSYAITNYDWNFESDDKQFAIEISKIVWLDNLYNLYNVNSIASAIRDFTLIRFNTKTIKKFVTVSLLNYQIVNCTYVYTNMLKKDIKSILNIKLKKPVNKFNNVKMNIPTKYMPIKSIKKSYIKHCIKTNYLIKGGSYGEVYFAIDLNGVDVAVKKYNNYASDNNDYVIECIASNLSAKCILPILHTYIDVKKQLYYNVYPRIAYTLSNYYTQSIVTYNTKFSHIMQLVSGMREIHAQNMAHRDLTPKNILIGSDDTLYIADWGSACVVIDPTNFYGDYYVCQICYRSYELINMYVKNNEPGYDSYDPYKIDVWSIACVIYFILTGDELFYYCSEKDMKAQIDNGYEFEMGKLDDEIANLLKQMLCLNPADRPTIDQVYDILVTLN